MLKDLMNNPIAWLILALVTIGSLVYAIYCQKANKERKEISYLLHSEQLILKERALFKEIKLICKEKELDNLCFSKIAIWNSGNKMLNGTDLAESQSLSIEVAQGVELIDYHIFDITEKSNHISVELDGTQKLNVSFDYLNPNDGIALLIIHSGEKDDIGVGGIIKGGMPIKRLSYTNPFTQKTTKKKTPHKKMLYSLYIMYIKISSVLLFIGTGIALLSELKIIKSEIFEYLFHTPNIPIIVFLVSLFIFEAGSFISLSIHIYNIKKHVLPSIPEKLKDFFNPYF